MKECPNVRLWLARERGGSMILQVNIAIVKGVPKSQILGQPVYCVKSKLSKCLYFVQDLQWTDMPTMCASNVARHILVVRHDVILRLVAAMISTQRSWSVVDVVMSVRWVTVNKWGNDIGHRTELH